MEQHTARSRDSHDSHCDRTAEWVAAQANAVYDPVSQPPSPILAATTMSQRTPHSNRTTVSSEQSIGASETSRHRDRHPSLSQLSPVPNYAASVPHHVITTREQTRFAFPQSPPGSGYPLMLEVIPPRADTGLGQSKVCALTCIACLYKPKHPRSRQGRPF